RLTGVAVTRSVAVLVAPTAAILGSATVGRSVIAPLLEAIVAPVRLLILHSRRLPHNHVRSGIRIRPGCQLPSGGRRRDQQSKGGDQGQLGDSHLRPPLYLVQWVHARSWLCQSVNG